MRVMQLVPALNSGGVEQGTLEIASFLVRNGHESLVVSSGGRLVERLQQQGSRHFTLNINRKSPVTLLSAFKLAKLMRQQRPDIVHVRSRVPGWVCYLALKLLPAKLRPHVVSTVHGFYSVNAYSAIMLRAERIIAVSQSTAEYISTNYPHSNPALVRVIPRGIEHEQFSADFTPDAEWLSKWQADYPQLAGKFVLCLPGRITRIKGHEDLLEMLAYMKANAPHIPLHALVVGEPSPRKQAYYAQIVEKVRAMGLQDDITFCGHRSDIKQSFTRCDVVLSLTNVPESFGRTTLEALGLGRPVFGYAHGGVAEQLEKMYPYGAVPVGDWKAIATRIMADWQHLPRPAGGVSAPFRLLDMCSSTLDVYRELLDGAQGELR